MGYDVSGMKHEEMVALIRRRLNKLAMCKRGTVSSDINKMREDLGNAPMYYKEERADIAKKSFSLIKKAMTPTLTLIKKYADDNRGLAQELIRRGDKATSTLYVHPNRKQWDKDREILKHQEDARIGTLDADFQDVEDEYILGIKEISELPNDLVELEKREW